MRQVQSLHEDLEAIANGHSPMEQVSVGTTSFQIGDAARVLNWQWVDVVNLKPVQQRFSNGKFPMVFSPYGTFDTCGVEPNGSIQILGFTRSGNALVEYSAPGTPVGTPCPSGAQYIISPTEFAELPPLFKF